MVLMHVNIRGRHAERPAQLLGQAGHILRGKMGENIFVVGPLCNATMGFQATMGNHRLPIGTLRDDLGFLKPFLCIALRLLPRHLVPPATARVRRSFYLGLLQGSKNFFFNVLLPPWPQQLRGSLKTDCTITDLLTYVTLRS